MNPGMTPSSPSPAFVSVVPTLDPRTLISTAFTLIFLVWIVYTLVVFYHWIRYGHRSWATVPALAAHLIITGMILIFMVSGFQ